MSTEGERERNNIRNETKRKYNSITWNMRVTISDTFRNYDMDIRSFSFVTQMRFMD